MTSMPRKLAEEIENVEWHWLRPHLERDALIVVSPALDLAEAARRIAADDAAKVGAWIVKGELAKPTADQITAWNVDPTRLFRMLIVQPYVLIQGLPAAAS